MSRPSYEIVDNFMEDEELLQKLNNKALWKDLDNLDYNTYYPKDPPSTVWHEVIQCVIHSPKLRLPNCKHFEYWCNLLDDRNSLDWHIDKNEEKAKKGKYVSPKLGVVFYGYPHKIQGGYLEIDNTYEMPVGPIPTRVDCERIEPLYNRVVVFDVSQEHRVAPVLKGTRYGLQINLW